MKANELMIGDWVVYNGDVEYTDPIKIEGMDIATDMLITSDREDVGFEGVEPIPLTGEILEKNGFNRIDENTYSFRRCGGDGEIKIRVIDLTCGEWELYAMDYDKYSDTRTSFSNEQSFLKVHELQHALKLCGIEKEIQL